MLTIDYKPIPRLTATERSQIQAITQPYYVDATQLLERELKHCTHIYLCQVDGQFAAYFMVGWETLTVNLVDQPALFLGLSCASHSFRNRKLVSMLFARSALDVADWQSRNNANLLVWFTTATPVVWNMMPRFYRVLQPALDGTFNEIWSSAGNAIQQRHYPHARPHSNPFVLKGVATATQYAPSERSYLDQMLKSDTSTIFSRLGINEPEGDRLLVLCSLPDETVLDKHRQLLTQVTDTSILPEIAK